MPGRSLLSRFIIHWIWHQVDALVNAVVFLLDGDLAIRVSRNVKVFLFVLSDLFGFVCLEGGRLAYVQGHLFLRCWAVTRMCVLYACVYQTMMKHIWRCKIK